MTWEIFLGIVALTGFVITIGKIVSANTKALTKLEDSILELNRTEWIDISNYVKLLGR